MPCNITKLLSQLNANLKASPDQIKQSEWIYVILPLRSAHECHRHLDTDFSKEIYPLKHERLDPSDFDRWLETEGFDIVYNSCILGNNSWSGISQIGEKDTDFSQEFVALFCEQNEKDSTDYFESKESENQKEMKDFKDDILTFKEIERKKDSKTNIISVSLGEIFEDKTIKKKIKKRKKRRNKYSSENELNDSNQKVFSQFIEMIVDGSANKLEDDEKTTKNFTVCSPKSDLETTKKSYIEVIPKSESEIISEDYVEMTLSNEDIIQTSINKFESIPKKLEVLPKNSVEIVSKSDIELCSVFLHDLKDEVIDEGCQIDISEDFPSKVSGKCDISEEEETLKTNITKIESSINSLKKINSSNIDNESMNELVHIRKKLNKFVHNLEKKRKNSELNLVQLENHPHSLVRKKQKFQKLN